MGKLHGRMPKQAKVKSTGNHFCGDPTFLTLTFDRGPERFPLNMKGQVQFWISRRRRQSGEKYHLTAKIITFLKLPLPGH